MENKKNQVTNNHNPAEGVTETELNLSGIDKMAIELVSAIVPDQTSKFVDGEKNVYEGTCKQVGNLSITIITRNGNILCQIVYDYNSGKEERFYGEGK